MVTTKSISRVFSVLLSLMILLTSLLPNKAGAFAGPRHTGDDFLWAKHMGGTSAEFSSGIALDSSGNFYTTGEFIGTIDFDPGPGIFNLTSAGDYYDIFVSKLDSNGNFIWAKCLGGTSNDQGRAIAVDASGNVYTSGTFQDTADFDPGTGIVNLTSAGFMDIFVSKLDSSGNFVWARSMGGPTSDDIGDSIAIDSTGVYTTGYFSRTADFDPSSTSTYNLTSAGLDDIFVSKLDTSGNFLWARRMGGTDYDFGNSIAVNSSGVYTTGYFVGTSDFDPGAGTYNLISAGYTDIYVSKLNTSGAFVWAKSMGGLGYDKSYGIALDSSNNVYTTGGFEGTVDFGTGNLISAGFEDIFVTKLDSSSNTVWAKRMGGGSGESGSSIAIDTSGNVYTTGVFGGTADFDPGSGTANLTSAGMQDVFVSKLDSFGAFTWAKRMGGTINDGGSGIALDSSSNIYTTGYFEGTADFGAANLTSAGSDDIFVTKIGISVTKYLFLPLIRR